MKLQNSLVGTKAFIKDSLRQCARLVKAFGTKLLYSNVSVRRQYTREPPNQVSMTVRGAIR